MHTYYIADRECLRSAGQSARLQWKPDTGVRTQGHGAALLELVRK